MYYRVNKSIIEHIIEKGVGESVDTVIARDNFPMCTCAKRAYHVKGNHNRKNPLYHMNIVVYICVD